MLESAPCNKYFYIGMGENISQSLLSQSNEDRDYHIFDEFTFYMIKLLRQKQVTDIFHLEDSVYVFDCMVIGLCLWVL